MSNKLSLLVNFIGVDKMSGALKNIIGLGKEGSKSLGALRGEGRKLNNELRDVRKEMAQSAQASLDLRDKERALERQIEETNQAIARQKERLEQLGRARGIKELGGKITSVGQSASLYLTAPLVAAGFASTQMAQEFNASMSNIATLVDTSTESMDLMGKQVLDLSKRVPVALEQLPPALYDIRSAGIQASDAMAVLEGSAKLAVAGLSTTQEAADVVTSSINAFGLQGAEQQRIYDLLFKTVKNGKTTISGLAQGFGGVAGTIANAGVQLDEYLSSVAALTTTGLPAAQAHTQLRAVIAGLTRDTEQSSAVFQKLGAKDYKDLISRSGGLVPALGRIKEALGGNDAEMLKLFGSTEALNAVLGLTGEQGEVFTRTLSDMRDGQNALDDAFRKQGATEAAKQIENLNKMQALSVDVGNKLMPIKMKLLELVGGLADSFNSLSPGQQSFVLGALGIVAVAGPLLIAVGGIVSIFGTLTAAAATLGVGVGALSLAVFGIPIAIAVVAGLIWYYWEDISAAFKWAKDKVTGWWDAMPAWMQNIGKAMMTGLLNAINPLALAEKLISVATNGIDAFKKVLDINSPSRVFMALGEGTTQGLAMGIDRGGRRSVSSMRDLAASVAAAGAFSLAPAVAAATQQNAPVAKHASGGATYNFTFNIQQLPGEDSEVFAERLRREIERMIKQAAGRSYRDDD